MRRAVLPSLLVLAWLVVSGGLAFAQAPAPPAAGNTPKATPGKAVCEISDDRLVELSGIVATATGYVVINDSSDIDRRNRVFFLDKRCNVSKVVQYGGNGPRDTEDMAFSKDRKTIWIADIGDNDADRQTVGLWRMPADGGKRAQLFRLKYPDGAKDAEGLLIGADGVPVIVTKGAKAVLYRPTGGPKEDVTVPLKKVGELTLPRTTTSNPLGPLGRITVTGAAAAPDGSRVVLRTYADAFEFDVSGGDVVKALTEGTPRITPLPDEPLGEAITYSPDGATFVTVSETSQTDGLKPKILRYTPAKEAAKPASVAAAGGGGGAGGKSWFSQLSLDDITYLIGGVGILGLVLVVLGVVGIVRARRRAAASPPDEPVGPRAGPGGGPGGGPASATAAAPVPQELRVRIGEPDFDPRSSGAVYGSGVYRSAPADDRPAGDEPRTGGLYGGGAQYRRDNYGPADHGPADHGPADHGPPDYRAPDYDRADRGRPDRGRADYGPPEPDRYNAGPRGYDDERERGGVYTGNGYSGDDRYARGGYAGRGAGRSAPPEPEYGPPGGYGYDEPDRGGRF